MKNIFQTKNLTPKILILFQSFFLLFFISITVNAQDSETSLITQDNDLKIINKVPKHLPIKIEILKGDTEDTLNDAEIKVTNTGEKPIYYLKFFISTPEDFRGSSGYQYGFEMRYGRRELVTFSTLATETDIPLKTGESHVFKVAGREAKLFNEAMRKNYNNAKPSKYLLEFQFLSFGDKTGFWTSGGTPFPDRKKRPESSVNLFPKEKPISFFLT